MRKDGAIPDDLPPGCGPDRTDATQIDGGPAVRWFAGLLRQAGGEYRLEESAGAEIIRNVLAALNEP